MSFIFSILAGIVTSFFYFPFEFTFLPGLNTKMVLAAIGLVLLPLDIINKRIQFDYKLIILVLISFFISLISLATSVINQTNDLTYGTYFISMIVWLSGAYTVCKTIEAVHGYLSLELICNYLIAVCAIQSLVAIFMVFIPPLKHFVDGFLAGDGYMGKADGKRLYGIGCALDVAGLKFSAALAALAFLSVKSKSFPNLKLRIFYFSCFAVIASIGSIISRSTMIGIIVCIGFWIYHIFAERDSKLRQSSERAIIITLIIIATIMTALYNTNPRMKDYIRFGFEGFFSLAERGQWEVSSNDVWEMMLVFPETMHTWIIGDGYMVDPSDNGSDFDPNYVGESFNGVFYKDTDIGYLRFIFYFGVIGLSLFCYLFYWSAHVCVQKQPYYKLLFFFVLLVNFAGWGKVSTDVFPAFALLICASYLVKEENEEYDASVASEIEEQQP